jgi:hypothetical protein
MRKPLSKRARFEVFKRDGFRCTYCGQRPPEVVLVVDHVVPVASGGTNEEANLTTSCYTCNAGKGAVQLGHVKPAVDEMLLAAAAQEAAERALMLQHQVAAVKAEKEQVEKAVEELFELWYDIVGEERAYAFQDGSITTFLRVGLEVGEIHNAMLSAGRKLQQKHWMTNNDLWKYFCAACWGTLRRLKEEQ